VQSPDSPSSPLSPTDDQMHTPEKTANEYGSSLVEMNPDGEQTAQ